MKKLFLFILVSICFLFPSEAILANISKDRLYIDNIKIYDEISQEKEKLIINNILGLNKIKESEKGLACIFGHSIRTGNGERTEHNYYSQSPKCRLIYFSYKICTRSDCSYYDESITTTVKLKNCH